MSTELHTLATLLAARRPDVAATLAAESTVADDGAFDPAQFELTFAALGRRFGSEAVGGGTTLGTGRAEPWSIAGWGLDEVARGYLIAAAIDRLPASEHVAWLDGGYRAGALRERQAMLRVLALLPEPARFLPIALDACRTSTQPIFEAIACENPYPARFFAEPSFNHLVMKAVFTDVRLARILGLMQRRTPDLTRMAHDYACERRAAGRSVPADLAILLDP